MAPALRDPATVTMSDGTPVARYLPPRFGLRGSVIGSATAGGIPEDFDPHDRTGVKINIVGADGSGGYSLPLSALTSERVQNALKFAKSHVSGNNIEAKRERVAMAFEELARTAATGIKKIQPNVPVPPPVPEKFAGIAEEDALIADLQQTTTAPPFAEIDRAYSPMAAFGLKQPGPQTTVARTGSNVSGRTKAPQQLVYFEKEGLGTVPAFYHDVLVQVSRDDPENAEYSGFMVLVYDLRFDQNAARWFPPSNDPYQRPWAALIKGDQRLYLVHTTGFQYVYDDREYCVLRVERAIAAPQAEHSSEV